MSPEDQQRVADLYRRAWRVTAVLMRGLPGATANMRFLTNVDTLHAFIRSRVTIAGVDPLGQLTMSGEFELFNIPILGSDVAEPWSLTLMVKV